MYRIITVCAVLGSLLLILPIPTHADPLITRDWVFIDNRPLVGDIFGIPGLRLNLSVKASDDGVYDLSSATADPSNPNFYVSFPGLLDPIPINDYVFYPVTGGAEFTSLPPLSTSQFPNVAGTYIFTVTDTNGGFNQGESHNLDKFEVIPIPTELAFSDNSTTPIFTFSDPVPAPGIAGLSRYYQVEIFDASLTNIFQSDPQITTSFDFNSFPSGILVAGETYYVRAVSMDIDSTETHSGFPRSHLESRALNYATLQTAVPEPSTILLLGSGLLGLWGFRRKFKN